ncbi:MAG: hypothetical protein AAB393_18035, partial [Bacteroidota bacterium]
YRDLLTPNQHLHMDDIREFVDVLKSLVGTESLSKATPSLIKHRRRVLPVSAGLVAIGLALCFFGWKIFKLGTVIGGVLSGVMLGLVLGSVIAGAIGKALPEGVAKWGTRGLFLLIGIPLAVAGAQFGRRFAMFGARSRVLGGFGSGWMGSIFALTRFAFFDLSVIWGHALFGASLVIVGAYCATVALFVLPDDLLTTTLVVCVTSGVLLSILGVTRQIKTLRSEPRNGYQGEG